MPRQQLINDQEMEYSYQTLENKIELNIQQNIDNFNFPTLALSNIHEGTSLNVSNLAIGTWTASPTSASPDVGAGPWKASPPYASQNVGTDIWKVFSDIVTGTWNASPISASRDVEAGTLKASSDSANLVALKNLDDMLAFTGLSEKSFERKKPTNRIDPFLDIFQFSKEPDMLFDYHDPTFQNPPIEKSRWGHFVSKIKQKQKPSIKKTLKPISKKRGLDVTLSYLREHFQISDEPKLTKFILKTSFNLMDDFHDKLIPIASLSQSFLKETGMEFNGNIEYFEDDEIENFESISMSFSVKDFDSEKCFKLTEKLVSEIAKTEPEILNYIQIEIVPYV